MDPLPVEHELHDPDPEEGGEQVLGGRVGQPGEHRGQRVGREQQENVLSTSSRKAGGAGGRDMVLKVAE